MATTSGKVYLHADIEADGNSPANSNMLGFGVVATNGDGTELGAIEANIFPRDEVTSVLDPVSGQTKLKPLYVPGPQLAPGGFWTREENQPAWEYLQKNRVSPTEAMSQLDEFRNKILDLCPGSKIDWVMRPAAYDWQWIKAYWELYAPEGATDIGFSATCLSTMRDARKNRLRQTKEEARAEWASWTAGHPLTHKAIDDARHQAAAFHGLCEAEGNEL